MGCKNSKPRSHNEKISRSTLRVDTFGGSNEEKRASLIKFVLTGNSGVGKSVFFHNYFGTMDKFSNKTTPSNGDNNCKQVEVKGKGKATVTIWDTAGQERYSSITNIFYYNSNGIFLLYDVTTHFTFDELEKHWLANLDKTIDLSKVKVCLIANKIDKDNRVVTSEEGEAFARKHGFIYKETSALQNKGINEAVLELTAAVLERTG